MNVDVQHAEGRQANGASYRDLAGDQPEGTSVAGIEMYYFINERFPFNPETSPASEVLVRDPSSDYLPSRVERFSTEPVPTTFTLKSWQRIEMHFEFETAVNYLNDFADSWAECRFHLAPAGGTGTTVETLYMPLDRGQHNTFFTTTSAHRPMTSVRTRDLPPGDYGFYSVTEYVATAPIGQSANFLAWQRCQVTVLLGQDMSEWYR